MKNLIVFINGVAGSGKDEFVKHIKNQKRLDGLQVFSTSSIDPVRALLGIDESNKSPETRKVLADVGEALEVYNMFRTRGTAISILNYIQNGASSGRNKHNDSYLIFVHVREMKMMFSIEARVKLLNSQLKHKYDLAFAKVLMLRGGLQVVDNNASDLEAANAVPSDYDLVFTNDGTLQELNVKAENFASSVHSLFTKKVLHDSLSGV